MVTVTFQIKPYLAAYMYMRYKNHLDVPPDRSSSSLSAIHLRDTQPIYHFLHQLSIPPPSQRLMARNRKYYLHPPPIPETAKIQMYIII